MTVRTLFNCIVELYIKGERAQQGKEVYRHPEGLFIVLEFQGVGGRFREAFWPEEIVKVEG